MKAIHNSPSGLPPSFETVFNTSKVQNESNSQLAATLDSLGQNCIQYVKSTK